MTTDLGREAQLAIRAVADAMVVAQEIAREASSGVLSKSDASPVTVADFVVQALVAARLMRDCPDDALVAEEDAAALRAPDADRLRHRIVELVGRVEAGADGTSVLAWIDRGGGAAGTRFWTLDPIDGTRGLLRGDHYAIALALVVEGTVQLGVLGCPRLSLGGDAAERGWRGAGGIAVGVRGRGAWWFRSGDATAVRLTVSRTDAPAAIRLLHSVESRHSDVARLDRLVRSLGLTRPPILLDSQAKHATLAAGEADLLVRFPSTPGFRDAIWDQAAGSVIVEEAGGRVTDLAGRPLDFSTGRRLVRNDGLVASNGRIHDVVLAAIGALTAPHRSA
jgi:3'(2'), 5'-bisphosphate nucleotidase